MPNAACYACLFSLFRSSLQTALRALGGKTLTGLDSRKFVRTRSLERPRLLVQPSPDTPRALPPHGIIKTIRSSFKAWRVTLSDTHNPPGWLYQVCRQGVVSSCRSAVFVTSVPVEPVSRLLLSPDWPIHSSTDKKNKKNIEPLSTDKWDSSSCNGHEFTLVRKIR